MMYDGNVPFGPQVEAINRSYAAARGYEFVSYHHFPDPNLDPYWNRLRVLQQELDRCDVLWWIDADAFFLNQDASLPAFTDDIAMSTDWNGVCCGVMAVRNTSWTRRFLDAWVMFGNVRGDRIDKFDNGQFREQTTLKAMCYYWPLIECHIGRLSEQVIQCFTSQFWAKALVLHMWACHIGADRCLQTLAKFKAEGYTPATLQRP